MHQENIKQNAPDLAILISKKLVEIKCATT